MSRPTPLASLALGLLLASTLAPASALAVEEGAAAQVAQDHRIDVVISAHGATFLPWEATDETGNGYGLSLGLNLGDARLLLGYGGVLPESTPEARFSVLWTEAQWHPFHEVFANTAVPLSPYALVGAGVAMPTRDDDDDDETSEDRVQWTGAVPQVMGIVGVGLAVGRFDGFFVSADMRMYNATYGGFVVTAGHCF